MKSPSEAALALARRNGVLRVRDAAANGIHPEVLRRLVSSGQLMKAGRGMYAPASADTSEHASMAYASARVPNGVICLLSALGYHGIGTQMPREVWMMINTRAHKPVVDHPPMRFVRATGATLREGIQEVMIDGRAVRVFSPAKTVVDCFIYRRHVGLEAAIEALWETLRGRRGKPAEIDRYAALCGVATVVRPYLEAMAVLCL
jgi:predicted transcriptional regulator of viral defense system